MKSGENINYGVFNVGYGLRSKAKKIASMGILIFSVLAGSFLPLYGAVPFLGDPGAKSKIFNVQIPFVKNNKTVSCTLFRQNNFCWKVFL